ncbi:Vacuolar protein sorting/targeting protein 10 [Thelohanellus kitauei]|uniref:Vacuolar protein sorting/targeting protein 10 n=1 Tax=Thelohanellus kitauei TaxID=669202 RepID=A0A0C2MRF3_THEKT|nr:Vacuolar protein sorting/targeting protein 10 [Thelohanellus kitauei]
MTIDGGHSWNPTPKSASSVILLNYETVTLSISYDLIALIYSFDKRTTWLNHNLFPTKSKPLHYGKLSDNDLKSLIITQDSEANVLRFDILDFSNIFKYECQTRHLHQVHLLKSRGFCYRGKNINIIKRKPEILCINKQQEKLKVESICPCMPDDFNCAFNFQAKNDICILDPLSNITEKALMCDKGFRVDINQLGYIKLAHDTCDPHEIHRYSSVASNIPFVQNELSNFLILSSTKKIYVSQIMFGGGHFNHQLPFEVFLNNKTDLNRPIAFDYLQQHLYNYLGKYITRFQMDGQRNKFYIFRIIQLLKWCMIHCHMF